MQPSGLAGTACGVAMIGNLTLQWWSCDSSCRTKGETIGSSLPINAQTVLFNNGTDMNHVTLPTIPTDLLAALRQAQHVVVFTGAGVSAESGIPTFRDALTGLWERFDAEDLATPDAFRKDKELVWGWYEWRRMKVLQAQPNPAHLAIVELAKFVPKLTLITQNVDDLHERAGSTNVVHLHGSLHAPRCETCRKPHIFSAETTQVSESGARQSPPVCSHCGGFVRPGVVWFGEQLPGRQLNRAFAAAKECDVLLTIGTSGLVEPAASIPLLAKRAGACVVQVNPASTSLDRHCNWSLRGTAGDIMPSLVSAAFASGAEQIKA